MITSSTCCVRSKASLIQVVVWSRKDLSIDWENEQSCSREKRIQWNLHVHLIVKYDRDHSLLLLLNLMFSEKNITVEGAEPRPGDLAAEVCQLIAFLIVSST